MPARRLVLAALLTALVLSGCGFRLAGTAEMPPRLSSIYLVADNFDERQRKTLRRTLENAGAKLAPDAGGQTARLNVSLKGAADQQMATGASTGETVKRVARALDYFVKAADGSFIVEPRTLKQQRDIVFDENNLLSSNRERETVIRELEQALYDQLVRQLSRL